MVKNESKKKIFIISAFLLLLLSCATADFSLVENGSFETWEILDENYSLFLCGVGHDEICDLNTDAFNWTGWATGGSDGVTTRSTLWKTQGNYSALIDGVGSYNWNLAQRYSGLHRGGQLKFDYNVTVYGADQAQLCLYGFYGGTGATQIGGCIIRTSAGSSIGTITYDFNLVDYNALDYYLNCERIAGNGGLCAIDNVQYDGIQGELNLSVYTTPDPAMVDEGFVVVAELTYDTNGENNPSAVCNITLLTDTNTNMPYYSPPDGYSYTPSISDVGTHNFMVVCHQGNFQDVSVSGAVSVVMDFRNYIKIENIHNVEHEIDAQEIKLYPLAPTDYIEFGVKSGYGSAMDIDFNIFNVAADNRFYYVYTSTDGTNYAFSDSLTFGTTTTNGLQKIWNGTGYSYRLTDTIAASGHNYYKLMYWSPMHYETTFSDTTTFYVQPPAEYVIYNNRPLDIFSVSSFSDLNLLLINELPDLDSTPTIAESYVLTFTASASAPIVIYVDSDGSTASAIIDTIQKTLSFDVRNEVSIYTDANAFATIQIEQFMIHERGYFTEDLRVYLDAQKTPLPIYLDTDTNKVYQYLPEGHPFYIETSAYDQNSEITKIKIETYLTSISDTNKLWYWEEDISLEYQTDWIHEYELYERTIEIKKTMNGIFILDTSIASGEKIRIKVSVCDDTYCFAEQETQDIRFHQYPFQDSDVFMDLTIASEQYATNPYGDIKFETTNPDALEYLRLAFYTDESGVIASDYNRIFIKGVDFTCDFAGICDFDYFIDDWVWNEINTFYVHLTAKFNTQDLDYTDEFVNRIYTVVVRKQAFEGIRSLYLPMDTRSPRKYKTYEELPIVFAMQTALREPTTELTVVLKVWDLGTVDWNGNADAEEYAEDLNFYPQYYWYDENSGINYWAFNLRLREDGSVQLTNAHYYRLFTEITDPTLKYNTDTNTRASLSLEYQTGESPINHDASQGANEISINMDDAVALDPPSIPTGFEQLMCNSEMNNDIINMLGWDVWLFALESNPFATPIAGGVRFVANSVWNTYYSRDCSVVWQDNSQWATKINFWIYNNKSDLTEPEEEYQQFMKVSVPIKYLIFNKGNTELKRLNLYAPVSCKNEYAADTVGRIGCAIGALGNFDVSQILDAGYDVFEYFTVGEDFNAVDTVSPSMKYIKIRIENLRPMNAWDFRENEIDMDSIEPKKWREYLIKVHDADFSNVPPAQFKVFQNGQLVFKKDIPNKLWVDAYWGAQEDVNAIVRAETLWNLRTDILYNNSWNSLNPIIVGFKDSIRIQRQPKDFGAMLQSVLEGDTTEIQEGIILWFKSANNIIIFVLGILVLLILGYASITFLRAEFESRHGG